MGRADDEELDEDTEEPEAEVEEEEEATPEGRNLGGFAAGMAVGALLGAFAALLLAPAPGHVTRRRLRRKLAHVREAAGDEWESLSRRAKREIKRRVESV